MTDRQANLALIGAIAFSILGSFATGWIARGPWGAQVG